MSSTSLNVALLSDCTVEHLLRPLEQQFKTSGMDVRFSLFQFGKVESQVFDPASELYESKPDVFLILNATQELRSQYYQRSCGDEEFFHQAMSRHRTIFGQIRKHSPALIIQSTYVEVSDRIFGNSDHLFSPSLLHLTRELNRALREEASGLTDLQLLDVQSLASYLGHKTWFDPRLWYLGKSYCSPVVTPTLSERVAGLCQARFVKQVKCIVVDLDETLWGGILGDDGPGGISLSPEGEGEIFRDFQSHLKELRRRGILLAVASKNDIAAVLEVFRNHPDMILRESDVAVFKANWESKVENLKLIARELQLGLNSLVFLDDNPLERDLVRTFLPEVLVPELPADPSLYLATLTGQDIFETAFLTDVDKSRSLLMVQEGERSKIRETYASVDDYLKELRMKAMLTPFEAKNLDRIVQLGLRSNQFNLRTRRFNHSQIKAMMEEDGKYITLSVTLEDRLGQYGLIGLMILSLEGESAFLEEWLMSCRVFSRGVEQMVMTEVMSLLKTRGIRTLVGEYVATERNRLVRDLLPSLGFVTRGEKWEIQVAGFVGQKHFITVTSKGLEA